MPLSFLIIRLYILKLFSFLYIRNTVPGELLNGTFGYRCCWSLGISNHIFRMGQLLFFLEEICHTSLDVLWRASSPTQNDNNKRKMSRIVLFRAGNFCIIFSEYLSNCIYIFIDIYCVLFRWFFIAIQTVDTVPHHHRQSRSSWYRKFKFFPVHFYLLFLTTCHFSLFFSWLSVGNMYMQGLTHTHMDIITSPPCPTQSPIATSGVVKRKKSGSLTTVMSLCVLCFIRSIKESKKIRKIKKGLAMVCLWLCRRSLTLMTRPIKRRRNRKKRRKR